MRRTPTGADKAEHAEFTETNYHRLLKLAASKYRFASFGDGSAEPFAIWRHDVDYSPHRALAFARLESALSLRCVYHILVSSRYYSVFEPETAEILRQIGALGHEVGLHFDMDVAPAGTPATEAQVLSRISLEKQIIEAVVGVPVGTMSFHNYVLHETRLDKAEEICGMLNTSADRFRNGYKYVSDSNGIWRHDRLEDVLQKEEPFPRLHVLTHPIWWTPEAMLPVMRLRRVVDGRAHANMDFYTNVMKRDGRLLVSDLERKKEALAKSGRRLLRGFPLAPRDMALVS